MLNRQVKFEYTNYRGETAIRTATPELMMWGSTDFHPEPQWLIKAFDHDKNEYRIFAWKDMKPLQ